MNEHLTFAKNIAENQDPSGIQARILLGILEALIGIGKELREANSLLSYQGNQETHNATIRPTKATWR